MNDNSEENEEPAQAAFENLAKHNISFGINNKKSSSEDEDSDNDNNINNEEEAKKSEKIWNPRPYQQKIYEKALEQNSVIFVETGKGKTFISIMLMAHHLGIDINNNKTRDEIDKNKKIIFFVCDTALINQQKKHIEEILKIEVGTIQGKKDKKSKSDYEAFIKKWKAFNVFVAIPSIIYKILSCGFINIFQITMLIFDECHHANLDHPYNKIMEEFYFFYKKLNKPILKFPRIYGLTASPMKTRINGNSYRAAANDALVKLSENLDSVIIIDPEVINFGQKQIDEQEKDDEKKNVFVEVKTHVEFIEYKKVILELHNNFFNKISILGYAKFPEKYKEFGDKKNISLYQEYIKEKFKSSNLGDYNNICQENIQFYNLKNYNRILYIFEKMQRHIFLILENLGLESLITYFDKLIQLYEKLHQKKENEKENEDNSNEDSSYINSEENEESEDEEIILNLDSEIISLLKKYYQDIKENLCSKMIKGELYYTSDRLNKLFETVGNLFKSNDKAKLIIFIANRIVAHILNPTLSKFLKEKFPNKKCNEIIGVNYKKTKSSLELTPTITLSKLNKIVKDFNDDNFDILIGTSAIEEGLDIQSCNAVISLAEIQTPKSYIQMKGRARKTDSLFYIFSYSIEETKGKVRDFLEIRKSMKELFNNDIKKDFRRMNYIKEKKDFIFRFNPKTHSKLTPGNVSIFFNEIRQQIESCGYKFSPKIYVADIKNTTPQKFIGKIDVITDLKWKVKESYKTNLCNSKDDATKMCYLWVLISLIEQKYLDDHLKFCKDKLKKNK